MACCPSLFRTKSDDRGEHLVWRVEVEWYINGRTKRILQKLLAEWLEDEGGG